jgi:hypothetical protein
MHIGSALDVMRPVGHVGIGLLAQDARIVFEQLGQEVTLAVKVRRS